jgi:hypothetical protein
MIDLEACRVAGEILKAAGFELRYTSMKSEACYYGWPGRPDVLRVAAHRHGHEDRWQMPVAATLTFNAANFRERKSGIPHLSRTHLMERLATAVGKYMLRTAGVEQMPSRYRADFGLGTAQHRELRDLHE